MTSDPHDSFEDAFRALNSNILSGYRNSNVEVGGIVVLASDGWRISNIVTGVEDGIPWNISALEGINDTTPIYAIHHLHPNIADPRPSGSRSLNIANGVNGDIGAYRELIRMNPGAYGVLLLVKA